MLVHLSAKLMDYSLFCKCLFLYNAKICLLSFIDYHSIDIPKTQTACLRIVYAETKKTATYAET